MSGPSHVYSTGIGAPSSNAGELTPKGGNSVVVVEIGADVVVVVGGTVVSDATSSGEEQAATVSMRAREMIRRILEKVDLVSIYRESFVSTGETGRRPDNRKESRQCQPIRSFIGS